MRLRRAAVAPLARLAQKILVSSIDREINAHQIGNKRPRRTMFWIFAARVRRALDA
jgi:hypothetical protein